MKTLLFVLPGLSTGGTNTSFNVLYSHIKKCYNIHVLALDKYKTASIEFSDALIPQNPYISGLFCNIKRVHGVKQLFISIIAKGIKLITRFIGVPEKSLVIHYIKRIESSIKPDVVVAFEEGQATHFVSYFNCAKKVAWIHCDFSRCVRSRIDDIAYMTYSYIVCVSKYTRSVFLEHFPQYASKTLCINNMIDYDRVIQMSMAPIDDSRFEKRRLTIISVGRIHKVKRFSLIPQVAAQLKRNGVEFVWYIIGPYQDVEEKITILNKIKELDLCDDVKILGNKTNPYPFFRESSLYVCLSESEACPMVFNEARILGVPVITTPFGSAEEFITNGFDGIICDIKEMPNTLTMLANNPTCINSLRENSSVGVISNESILQQIYELL